MFFTVTETGELKQTQPQFAIAFFFRGMKAGGGAGICLHELLARQAHAARRPARSRCRVLSLLSSRYDFVAVNN